MEVGEMPDREELMYRIAEAFNQSRLSAEWQEAADDDRASVQTARLYHSHAADLLDDIVVRLQALHEHHLSGARRIRP